eukprot:TRINITY_DN1091_c0_g1_i1.p1 TRINITY_DN1091_c0_g1~~TRINITY_DN1091_c0_g1_i1.p1  ORF type:complete len:949 (+),score=215.97 TRINITY_DN1091_c0_g1_i1:67-2847(+)
MSNRRRYAQLQQAQAEQTQQPPMMGQPLPGGQMQQPPQPGYPQQQQQQQQQQQHQQLQQQQPGFPQQQQPGFPQQPQPGVGFPQQPQQQPLGSPQPAGVLPQQPQAQAPRPVAAKSPAKLDPSRLPNPTMGYRTHEVIKQLEKEAASEPITSPPIYTAQDRQPPPRAEALLDYFVNDSMNCSPRFLRSSMSVVPTSSSLCRKTRIPFGLLAAPLAAPGFGEQPVPIIPCENESGPVRCNRCRAYINCFALFDHSGQHYTCALCDFQNEVPQHYFSPMVSGQRQDLGQRPELWRGSVDFEAPSSYIAKDKPLGPPSYLFLIDTSPLAMQQGLLQSVTSAIQRVIPALMEESPLRIGFMTFDGSIICYNTSPSLKQPQMAVMPNAESPFLPIPAQAIFHTYSTAKGNIDTLLQSLPSIFASPSSPSTQVATGAAIRTAVEAVSAMGVGKVLVFTGSLPTLGPGRLQKRDQMARPETPDEKKMYAPQGDFWEKMGAVSATKGVGIDFFVATNSYVDLATIGAASKATGGQVYYYPAFNGALHQEQLFRELYMNLSRESGFNGLLRLRTSTGLSVSTQSGNFVPANVTDMTVASMSSSSLYSFEFEYDETLKEDAPLVFQLAFLYTSMDGHRRIRVHTLGLTASDALTKVFKGADLDVIVHLLTRPVAAEIKENSMKDVRRRFLSRSVAMLGSYRKYCATSQNEGQLILPESLKLLPIYGLGLLKTPIFAPLVAGTHYHCLPDARSHLILSLHSMGLRDLTPLMYPLIWDIAPMAEYELLGSPNAVQQVNFPGLVRCSRASLDPAGIYLMDSLTHLYLWVGSQVAPEFLAQLMSDEYVQALDGRSLVTLQMMETNLSHRLFELLQTPRLSMRSASPDVIVVRQGTPLEARMAPFLREDGVGSGNVTDVKDMAYVDFLTHLHRRIQTVVND